MFVASCRERSMPRGQTRSCSARPRVSSPPRLYWGSRQIPRSRCPQRRRVGSDPWCCRRWRFHQRSNRHCVVLSRRCRRPPRGQRPQCTHPAKWLRPPPPARPRQFGQTRRAPLRPACVRRPRPGRQRRRGTRDREPGISLRHSSKPTSGDSESRMVAMA